MKALEQAGASYGPNGRIIMISFDALGEAFQKMMAGKLHASIECNPLLAGNVEQVIMDLEAGIAVVKSTIPGKVSMIIPMQHNILMREYTR